MKIRYAKPQDAEQLSKLIISACSPYRYSDFSHSGWLHFINLESSTALRQRILSDESFCLCMVDGTTVCGLITMRGTDMLQQCYVSPKYQGRGIARQLWDQAREICKQQGGDGTFWLKSSTSAISVYESFGFRVTGERTMVDGIVHTPMVFP